MAAPPVRPQANVTANTIARDRMRSSFARVEAPPFLTRGRARVKMGERVVVRGGPRSIELHADGFCDESGARRTLDLDRVLRGDAHAAIDWLDRFDFLPQPNTRAGRHLPSKAHPVGAVIKATRAVLDAIEGLAEARDQGQCQIAMGDSLAARHLTLGALDIDMDPLV